MRQFCLAPSNVFFVALLAVWLAGCATQDRPRIPGADPDLLKFLQAGKTTADDVAVRLGKPFATFEQGRVLVYHIGKDSVQGYYVTSMDGQTCRLVLVFDDRRVLQRQNFLFSFKSDTDLHLKSDPDLLKFLKIGQTIREDVLLNLGEPSATFEQAKVLTYCVVEQHRSGYRINYAQLPGYKWLFVDYSLVLVFDAAGVLQRQNLVPVR